MTRQHLPHRRACEAITFEHNGVAYVGTVSRFEDSGKLAEVFLSPGVKTGTALAHVAQALAVTASLALQYGAPAEVLAHALPKVDGGKPGDPLGALLDRLAADRGAAP